MPDLASYQPEKQNIFNTKCRLTSMIKNGFIPVWKSVHTIAIEEYKRHKGDQSKLSPKFSDFGDVVKWLDEKS